jgi:XTP/dITP diphosphohydrolase
MKSLTFITGNLNKLKWTQRYIHIPIEHKKLDLTEIQSLDPKEVIEHKVKEAYKILKKPVLVEDTSLVFHGLGRLPGPFIKWFLEELGTNGLCKIVPKEDRSATAKVTFGMYDGKQLHFYESTQRGSIAENPRGDNGFGWDPSFSPEGLEKTHAELTDDEFDEINLRRRALENFKNALEK